MLGGELSLLDVQARPADIDEQHFLITASGS
jgi:hypothetical protein